MKPALILFVLLALVIFGANKLKDSKPVAQPSVQNEEVFNPYPYKIPPIPNKRSYLTLLVGDSMTQLLGENAPKLRERLLELYPGHEFVNYNYGFGATNLLSLEERLSKETSFLGTSYPSILSQDVDLIIIESFGYNPLSEFSMADGLKKQEEILDKAVRTITKTRPGTAIAFMTPIAPSRDHYAKGTYDLQPEMRAKWVDERIQYIKNHVKFANEHGIPVIDVYTKSLDKNGNANLSFISNDFIHPSPAGIKLISDTIAEFIYDNKIFPQ